MKSRTLDWLGAATAAMAALLCWYLLTMEPGAASRVARRGPAAAALVTGRGLTAAPPPLRRDNPDFDRTLMERGKPWLNARGRDAAGLIALWDLSTHGSGALMEAQKRFPYDPRVCMAMIQLCLSAFDMTGVDPTILLWIDRLNAARPGNPEGPLQRARALAQGGDFPGALALLCQAGKMDAPRNDFLSERLRTAHEAALALGVSPGDAARLVLERPLSHSTTLPALRAAHKVIMEELAAAKASGSEERLMEIIHTGLLTAEKFETAITVRDQMHANDLQTDLLASLTSGAQLLPDGTSAVQWNAEVTGRRKYLQEYLRREAEATALLAAMSDQDITSYFKCFSGYGEDQARSFILPDEEPKK